MKSDLLLVVAGITCLITFLVVRHILRQRPKLGPPGFLAGLITALAFLGLCGSGQGLVGALSIPYAALALTLLLLCLLAWLSRCVRSRFSPHRTQAEAHGQDPVSHWRLSSNQLPASEPPSTGLRQRHAPGVESANRQPSDSQTQPDAPAGL